MGSPEDIGAEVYGQSGYTASARNLGGVSLSSDGIFNDGHDQQLVASSGTVAGDLTGSLMVPVCAEPGVRRCGPGSPGPRWRCAGRRDR